MTPRYIPDEYGIDELFIKNARTVHIERMCKGTIWIGIRDQEGVQHTVTLTAKNKKLVGLYEKE